MRRNIFVDGETELQQLERLLREPGFTLVFVYGRRRIGKTRLLSHFASGKTSVYYVAAEIPYESMCREFAESVKRSLGLPFSGDILEGDGWYSEINQEAGYNSHRRVPVRC